MEISKNSRLEPQLFQLNNFSPEILSQHQFQQFHFLIGSVWCIIWSIEVVHFMDIIQKNHVISRLSCDRIVCTIFGRQKQETLKRENKSEIALPLESQSTWNPTLYLSRQINQSSKQLLCITIVTQKSILSFGTAFLIEHFLRLLTQNA